MGGLGDPWNNQEVQGRWGAWQRSELAWLLWGTRQCLPIGNEPRKMHLTLKDGVEPLAPSLSLAVGQLHLPDISPIHRPNQPLAIGWFGMVLLHGEF